MIEVFDAAFMSVNVVFTILMLMVLLYWLLMIFGALDLDFLDLDFDSDGDIDTDMEAAGGQGLMMEVLSFFYVGKVPVMVVLTIFAMSLWVISMVGNYLLNPAGHGLRGFAIASGNIVASLAIVKIVGAPLAVLFRQFSEDPNRPKSVLGSLCHVVSGTITSKRMGQVEVRKTGGVPFLLNAMTQGEDELVRGDEAVVVEKERKVGVYIVAPVDLEK